MRGSVVEVKDVAACRLIEGLIDPGRAVAQADETVAQFDGHVRIDSIGQTGMHRPREIPLRTGRSRDQARADAGAWRKQRGNALIGEVRNGHARRSDARANVGRYEPPGAE